MQKDEQWTGRSEGMCEAEMLDMGSKEVGQKFDHID